jgi:hypothetical protein
MVKPNGAPGEELYRFDKPPNSTERKSLKELMGSK